jgi:hypothetical protein
MRSFRDRVFEPLIVVPDVLKLHCADPVVGTKRKAQSAALGLILVKTGELVV